MSYDAIKDLGCKPNDPNFDNGAVLSEAISEGRINDTIHFPGGAYYHTSTVYDCAKTGLCFEGQGITEWNIEGNYLPQRRGSSAVIFVYVGPPHRPAFKFQGVGSRVTGITIQRGWKQAPVRDGSVGVEFSRHPNGPPSGKYLWTHYAIHGFDKGMWFKESVNHADTSVFVHGRMDACLTAVKCDNPQTTLLEFNLLEINGPGENVFQFSRGGNLLVTSLGVCAPRRVLDLESTDSNTCSFSFLNFKIDPRAASWGLVEMHKPGPLNLYVRGLCGNKATIGERPIVLVNHAKNVPAGYHTIDVEMFGAPELSAFNGKSEAR